jgi:hypothetical protein
MSEFKVDDDIHFWENGTLCLARVVGFGADALMIQKFEPRAIHPETAYKTTEEAIDAMIKHLERLRDE